MKWIKEKRKNKSIYNMTKLELIANLKEKQKIIDKAIEYINKNILVGFNEVGFKSDIVAGIVVNDLLEILGDKDE